MLDKIFTGPQVRDASTDRKLNAPRSVHELGQELSELTTSTSEAENIWKTLGSIDPSEKKWVTFDTMQEAGLPKHTRLKTATLHLLSQLPDLTAAQFATNVADLFRKLSDTPEMGRLVDQLFTQLQGPASSPGYGPPGWNAEYANSLACLRTRNGVEVSAKPSRAGGLPFSALLLGQGGRWFVRAPEDSLGGTQRAAARNVPLSDLDLGFLEALKKSLESMVPNTVDPVLEIVRRENETARPPQWASDLLSAVKKAIGERKQSANEQRAEVVHKLSTLRGVGCLPPANAQWEDLMQRLDRDPRS